MRNLFKWSLILVAAIIVISVIADHWLLAIIVVLAGAALFFFKRRNEKATIAKNKEKMRSERPKLGDSYEDVLRYVTTYAEKIYSQDRSGIIADIDWFGDGDIYRVSLPLYAIKLSIRDYISKKDYDLGCVGWQWKSEQFARLYRGLVSEYQLVFPDGYSDSPHSSSVVATSDANRIRAYITLTYKEELSEELGVYVHYCEYNVNIMKIPEDPAESEA